MYKREQKTNFLHGLQVDFCTKIYTFILFEKYWKILLGSSGVRLDPWSPALHCHMRNLGQMTFGKTYPTLQHKKIDA